MFDPTIYENIKVVLEGEIYDVDLSGKILVTMRKDLVDLATMSRKFVIQFRLLNSIKEIYAEINLIANTEDLANEILERNDLKAGCEILIKFYIIVNDSVNECNKINNKLNIIWDNRPKIIQRLSYTYDQNERNKSELLNEISLNFGRKIDEENISDIHNLVEYTIKSLEALSK